MTNCTTESGFCWNLAAGINTDSTICFQRTKGTSAAKSINASNFCKKAEEVSKLLKADGTVVITINNGASNLGKKTEGGNILLKTAGARVPAISNSVSNHRKKAEGISILRETPGAINMDANLW